LFSNNGNTNTDVRPNISMNLSTKTESSELEAALPSTKHGHMSSHAPIITSSISNEQTVPVSKSSAIANAILHHSSPFQPTPSHRTEYTFTATIPAAPLRQQQPNHGNGMSNNSEVLVSFSERLQRRIQQELQQQMAIDQQMIHQLEQEEERWVEDALYSQPPTHSHAPSLHTALTASVSNYQLPPSTAHVHMNISQGFASDAHPSNNVFLSKSRMPVITIPTIKPSPARPSNHLKQQHPTPPPSQHQHQHQHPALMRFEAEYQRRLEEERRKHPDRSAFSSVMYAL